MNEDPKIFAIWNAFHKKLTLCGEGPNKAELNDDNYVYEYENTSRFTTSIPPWNEIAPYVEEVLIPKPLTPFSLAFWFDGFTSLTNIDLTNLDTRLVNDISFMFYGCYNLTEIVFPAGFGSQCRISNHCFDECVALEEFSFKNWNTSNLLDLSCMFANCEALTEIDFANINASSFACMDSMFMNCESLERLDMSELELSGVGDVRCLFEGCSNLYSVVFPENMGTAACLCSSVFDGCSSLNLDLSLIEIQKFNAFPSE